MKKILRLLAIVCGCIFAFHATAQGIMVHKTDGTKTILPVTKVNGISFDEDGYLDILLRDESKIQIPYTNVQKMTTFNYQEVMEIVVTTGGWEFDSRFGFYYFYGSVEGVYSGVKAGILIGKQSNLNKDNAISYSPRDVAGGEFKVSYYENELEQGTTYYYRAYAVYQGQIYYGETKNFETEKKSTGSLNGHNWVDLGLPSGTKWATCNIGANTIEGYGNYFAWGETAEKSTYGWNNYTYCNGSSNTCYSIGSDIAGTIYDVANVKWGSGWTMPSYEQFKELIDVCSLEYTKENGIRGWRFTGPNSNSIFLPAGGERTGNNYYSLGTGGYYWTSTQNPNNIREAHSLVYGSSKVTMDYCEYRKDGLCVRPVTK